MRKSAKKADELKNDIEDEGKNQKQKETQASSGHTRHHQIARLGTWGAHRTSFCRRRRRQRAHRLSHPAHDDVHDLYP